MYCTLPTGVAYSMEGATFTLDSEGAREIYETPSLPSSLVAALMSEWVRGACSSLQPLINYFFLGSFFLDTHSPFRIAFCPVF